MRKSNWIIFAGIRGENLKNKKKTPPRKHMWHLLLLLSLDLFGASFDLLSLGGCQGLAKKNCLILLGFIAKPSENG